MIANKTYPLPADYAPGFTGGTYKAFQVMQEAAANEGIKLEIISGFRSYEKQQQISPVCFWGNRMVLHKDYLLNNILSLFHYYRKKEYFSQYRLFRKRSFQVS